jgi:hypothetical protein
MSIHIKTHDPSGLLQDIVDKAKHDELDTWSIDDDGDFTHTPPQWKCEAWLSPCEINPESTELVFGIIKRKDKNLSKAVYAVYHGRFAEMLLTHFDSKIDSIELTSYPDENDHI